MLISRHARSDSSSAEMTVCHGVHLSAVLSPRCRARRALDAGLAGVGSDNARSRLTHHCAAMLMRGRGRVRQAGSSRWGALLESGLSPRTRHCGCASHALSRAVRSAAAKRAVVSKEQPQSSHRQRWRARPPSRNSDHSGMYKRAPQWRHSMLGRDRANSFAGRVLLSSIGPPVSSRQLAPFPSFENVSGAHERMKQHG